MITFTPGKLIRFSTAIIVLSLFTGCGTLLEPYISPQYENWRGSQLPDEEIINQVYLIGDVGSPSFDEQEPTLKLLEKMIKNSGDHLSALPADTAATALASTDSNVSVIFLGDNIYYHGLPEESASDRNEKEKVLLEQIKIFNNFNGNAFWLPGNHDWNYSLPGGMEAVMRQESFIEGYFNNADVFKPSNACPGPVEVHLNDEVVVIFMDSEWFLTDQRKPIGPEHGCYVEDRFDLIVQLDGVVERNEGKHILLVQHHPIISNSNHGGHYSIIDYIFPLTLVYDNLYIPLPILGSLYPLMRKYGISRQDIPNPIHQQLKKGIFSVAEDQESMVMATGHDHNLQLHQYNELYQIISGSGCKSNYAIEGSGADFVSSEEGFSRITYFETGEAWVEFFVPVEDGSTGEVVFRAPLYSLYPEEIEEVDLEKLPDYSDSIVTMVAGKQYEASGFSRIWLGDHYREVWTTPVEVPVLDMKTKFGGLSPLKKGGGLQTISLRVKDTAGVQYNIRSIDKNPVSVLPPGLRETFARDLVQDQISAGHPYGAFAIPKMANALGVYHTNPELVYVPHSPLLGPYFDEFAGMLAMIEIRPDEDLSAYKRFGRSENVVSTRTMLQQMREDNDDEVDQYMFLKSRFFDMLIGDWDRHEDQWRWAEYDKPDKGEFMQPVPRDRDQVFFKFDGVIPWFASRKWAQRSLQDFGYDFKDVKGLMYSGVHLDRQVLTAMDREDYLTAAKELQEKITDEVIDAAVRDMPEEAYEISGKEIAAKLKSRREQLMEAAVIWYEAMAEEVDIFGSNKHEFILVERLNDEETKVRIWKRKKDGEKKDQFYERTFLRSETDEIRIYAFAGEDSIRITGETKKGILVRVIGGRDEDYIVDESKVSGLKNKTVIYDNKDGNKLIEGNSETNLKLENTESIHRFDRTYHKYNYLGPRLFFEYNADDGIYIGGGATYKTTGFRKSPWSTSHTILGNYSTFTGAYTFEFEGKYYSLFGKNWDLLINGTSYGPKYVLNYFGQGNETPNKHAINYHRVRMHELLGSANVQHRFTDFFAVGGGPRYNRVKIEEKESSFLNSIALDESITISSPESWTGANVYAHINLLNNRVFPTRGIQFHTDAKHMRQLEGGTNAFTNWTNDVRFYVTPNLPFLMTVAFRMGTEHNFGDYPFYESAFLGNKYNLRGYRQSRFAGRHSFYNQNEIRFRISSIFNSILAGDIGIYGFYDWGRVWADNEQSNKVHMGYGPGIYLYLYNLFLVSGSYGISEEGQYFNIDAGFYF